MFQTPSYAACPKLEIGAFFKITHESGMKQNAM